MARSIFWEGSVVNVVDGGLARGRRVMVRAFFRRGSPKVMRPTGGRLVGPSIRAMVVSVPVRSWRTWMCIMLELCRMASAVQRAGS